MRNINSLATSAALSVLQSHDQIVGTLDHTLDTPTKIPFADLHIRDLEEALHDISQLVRNIRSAPHWKKEHLVGLKECRKRINTQLQKLRNNDDAAYEDLAMADEILNQADAFRRM